MKRRTPILIAGVAVAFVVSVAFILLMPRTVTETSTVTLSSAENPPSQAFYCIPSGTIFTYAWHTNDGSRVTLLIERLGTLGPPIPQNGSEGNGSLYAGGGTGFTAQNLTSSSVEVIVDISYSATVNYLQSPPGHPGNC